MKDMSKPALLAMAALGVMVFAASEKYAHIPGRDSSGHDAFFDVGLMPWVLGLGGMFGVAALGLTPVAIGAIVVDQLVLKPTRGPLRKRVLAERWGRVLGS